MKDIEIADKLCRICSSAKNRNIPFDMSFNKVKQLLQAKKCYYTGEVLTRIVNDDNELSFDRIDNEKGYIDTNVVACSKRFNSIKSNLTVKEIEALYKGLKKKKLIQ
jgi:hypothetical protein